MDDETSKGWGMSPAAAVHLAAPHTWPAAVLPVLLGNGLARALGAALDPAVLLGTLAAAVLLQSAVNTLNDYRDFVSGVDTPDNCLDADDAALIFDGASPRGALALGLAFLLGAAVCGGFLVYARGPALLVYAGIALAAILLYTLPGRSVSALPLGELLSGVTMGGVLTCAAFHAQAGRLAPDCLYLCLPAVLTIGCIMLTNNTADIQRDRAGGRHTLPVCIGQGAAQGLLRALLLGAAVLIVAFTLWRFRAGWPALPAAGLALLLHPGVRELFTRPVTPERRGRCMGGVVAAHTRLCAGYLAAVLLDCLAL